jgi:hypothetical protein
MLFVIGTDTAIVGAAEDGLGMRLPRIFASLIIIPDLFVIFDIGGDECFLKPMLLTGLGQIDLPLFKNDLCA